MELTERKRSRKSQSFKLVNQDYQDVYKGNENSNGEHTLASSLLGDEGMEIKKQITGMRRLLNDSTGRVYQRVGEEGENIKEELQDSEVAWVHPLNPAPETIQSTDPPQRPAWSSTSPIGHFSGKYGTRSKDDRDLMKTAEGSNGEIREINSLAGSNCCTCNCQTTLQAILEELKAIRKCMQLQAVKSTSRKEYINSFTRQDVKIYSQKD